MNHSSAAFLQTTPVSSLVRIDMRDFPGEYVQQFRGFAEAYTSNSAGMLSNDLKRCYMANKSDMMAFAKCAATKKTRYDRSNLRLYAKSYFIAAQAEECMNHEEFESCLKKNKKHMDKAIASLKRDK